MNINSKEYWDNRFDTDWLEFSGDQQTAFFANLMCAMLPKAFVNEVRKNEYSVCDMGCALGEGVAIFSRKFAVDVDGMDFSVEAIQKAKKEFPDYNFWTGDLRNLDQEHRYDVIICSNVLEHFRNPWKIVKGLSEITNKYMVLMFPYKEKLVIDEHMYHFSENEIPVTISDFFLTYVGTVDGNNFENSLYPDQQILLIYKKNCRDMLLLSELTEGIVESERRANKKEQEKSITMIKKELLKMEERLQKVNEEINIKNEEIKVKNEEINIKNGEIQTIQQECDQQRSKNVELLSELANKNALLERKLAEIENVELEKKAIEAENVEIRTRTIEVENALLNARSLCMNINSKVSYKVMCSFARFVRQFIFGSFSEKKKFLGICKRCLTREKSEFTKNDGYNMILNVANLLEVEKTTQATAAIEKKTDCTAIKSVQTSMVNPMEIDKQTLNCLQEKYDKPDVLIFSVINYDFRYQRPQHFATRFAENGHRVFYIDANFVNHENIKEVTDKLYIVDFYNENCNAIYYASESKDFSQWFKKKLDVLIQRYAICDAMIILDYPNWIYGAEYLRKTYGFKIIVDYMDDFTGFLGTTTDVLKDNCIHMLEKSDMVVASSKFLCDIATKYTNNVRVVRNGTEVEHFFKAVKMQSHKKRPVIGYYGAVSHWFAWEKVCFIAEKMPEADIVIIGEITEYRDKLEKYENIKLLGEKKYTQLPEHLAYFDVCLIPFDTSTDLIKATNPVKFYEYLSAGKRVVATEIPELEPFRDEYVYMSNDNEIFLKYVRLCLTKKDTLKQQEECIAFARENDWQKRYELFAEACKAAVPKVSIVVLTYNNLSLNKVCIRSVLDKTAYPNFEFLILDNNSSDGTVEYLRELEKEGNQNVKIIINEKNSGFAGGNNIAIKQSTGDFVMLLNNDTVVTRGWLTNAVKHMENDESCGMCGAVTNSIGNEAMIGVVYKNLDELDSFAYQYTRKHNNEVYANVDRLAMFCTLIRKEIMEKHGLLDENYQVGMFEDDDYAQVVKKAGYHFYIAEDVFIHHVNNASFKKLQSEEYKKIFEKNKNYFEQKWAVKWRMPKYREGVNSLINDGMMVEPKR